jgi:hypothetical protein
MPVHGTRGAASVEGFGFGAGIPYTPIYVENVFSTYLYAGTTGAQTFVNNIDLTDNGGLVILKGRSISTYTGFYDTVRGPKTIISANDTRGNINPAGSLSAFNTNGFSFNATDNGNWGFNNYGNLASWTFRKQANFFDIVTYTGTGSAQTIAHNLGSIPGCIIVKRTDTTGNWQVYHSGLTSAAYSIQLNSTAAQASATTVWYSTAPTSTVFTVGTSTDVNASGGTYIAYLFGAGGTGGFGLTGTQDIISCGSYTGTGSSVNTITLGYEPQWILIKNASGSGTSWVIEDTMRQMSNTDSFYLLADTTATETDVGSPAIVPTATGFKLTVSGSFFNATGNNYIYIAIRRGPMATPTTGASVFTPLAYTGTGPGQTETVSNLPDTVFHKAKANTSGWPWTDRLRGTKVSTQILFSNSSGAATGNVSYWIWSLWNNIINWSTTNSDDQTGNNSGESYVLYALSRAPGFYDTVCYTGAGSATTQNHNLGVIPQLMIFKNRSNTADWFVYCAYSDAGGGPEATTLRLDSNVAAANSTNWNSTPPTSTLVNLSGFLVSSGQTYVGYLFATVTGVSYVGSYTGTGATQSIACGFGAGGARFILAKRTDSTGDWYVFDSSNGLTSSSSPYLTLDTTNTQTTGNNGTYASSGGFTLTSASPVNTSGGSFIFLAIA